MLIQKYKAYQITFILVKNKKVYYIKNYPFSLISQGKNYEIYHGYFRRDSLAMVAVTIAMIESKSEKEKEEKIE